MLGGIILILSGVLIAIYPPLLSMVVASLLLVSGILIIIVAYQNKRQQTQYGNPIMRIFFICSAMVYASPIKPLTAAINRWPSLDLTQ